MEEDVGVCPGDLLHLLYPKKIRLRSDAEYDLQPPRVAGPADDGPVCERVRERKADLDDVGAARDRRLGQFRCVRPGHQVDDERLPVLGTKIHAIDTLPSQRRAPIRDIVEHEGVGWAPSQG